MSKAERSTPSDDYVTEESLLAEIEALQAEYEALRRIKHLSKKIVVPEGYRPPEASIHYLKNHAKYYLSVFPVTWERYRNSSLTVRGSCKAFYASEASIAALADKFSGYLDKIEAGE